MSRPLSKPGTHATPAPPSYRFRGLLVALSVLILWATTLALAWSGTYPAAGHWLAEGLIVLVLTLLYTGLFITAHDAMHGLVAPRWPRLNHAIGWLALTLFAALDYRRMHKAHLAHHQYPSSEHDPDFHADSPPLLGWYLRFMAHYVTIKQLLIMALAFNALQWLGVELYALLLLWIAPQLLSTVQLFVVGTWLPHRAGVYDGDGPRKARSLDLPPLFSLLACYHFGYHYEHHAWPYVPWWRLPGLRGRREPQDGASNAGG